MTSRTNRTRIKRRFLAAALFILLLATALRFYRLDAQSFWNDEGNSARLSERSLALILEGTASDIHPPLYYLLLRGWRELLGDSEFGLRSLSAFAGVAVVALVVALGRVAYPGRGRPTALLAGLLAALSPALIYYSQEARMYALLALWAALSTLLLLRLPGRAYSHRLALAYVLTSAAGLYTHYFYPAVLLWQNILVLIHIGHEARSPHPLTSSPPHPSVPSPLRRLGHWAALMLLTLLLYLPWLPIFLRQAGGRPGDSTPLLDFGRAAVRFLALGPAGDAATLLPLLILAGFALLAALDWRRRPDVPGLAPWLGVLVPLLFMAVVGTTRPAYEKFLLAALPFFCLLPGRGLAVAWGWSAVLRPAGRRAAQLALLALGLLALIGPGRALANLYNNPAYARADYRTMAARIAADAHPNAGIILDAANQWEVFTYYHRDGAPVYPLPAGRPDPDRIAADLSEIAARHQRLYAIFWGEAERDPQRLVERWLDTHAFKATEEWVGDVRFVMYALPPAAAVNMATPAGVRFGPDITLLGYTLTGDTFPAGDIIPLTLFWQTDRPLATRYKIFLHLVTADGTLVTQRDSEPGGGLALTTTWPPGETVIDNHGLLLPPGTPPGRYTLLLGLYDLADPAARLEYVTPAGERGDALPLATITVP